MSKFSITEEQQNKIIELLPEEYVSILKMRYGENFDGINVLTLDKNQNSFYYRFIQKNIKKIIENGYKIDAQPKVRKRISFCEYFNVEQEQKDKILLLLPEEYVEVLKVKYGENYDGIVTSKLTQSQANCYFKNIEKSINDIIESGYTLKISKKQKGKNAVTLDKFLDIDKKHLKEIVGCLTERKRNIVALRYGENYDSEDIKKLSKSEMSYLYNKILPVMKEKANSIKLELEPYIIPINGHFDAIIKPDRETAIKEKEELLNNIKNLVIYMSEKTNPEMCTIVSLNLGLINDKCYSSKEIAELLNIDSEEVITILKQAFTLFSNNIKNINGDNKKETSKSTYKKRKYNK